jgi:hypothetical protein
MDGRKFFVSVLVVSITLYAYLNKHNALTMLRIKLPQVKKELKAIEEENTRLRFEIEKFEQPLHLMELARKPQYAHLKHPNSSDIIILYDEQP